MTWEQEFADAGDVLAAGVPVAEATRLIQARQFVPLLHILNWRKYQDAVNTATEALYAEALRAAGQSALDEVTTKAEVRSDLNFSVMNPRVRAWAQRHAAELVTAVTRQTRNAIWAAVDAAVDKFPPRQLARMVLNTGVGLTRPWAQAVVNRAAELGVGPDDPRVQRYAQQLLRSRSRMIARTELLRAQNAGRVEAWRQAMDHGFLSRQSRKRWVASPNPCPICGPLNMELVEFEANFSVGVDAPPAHPHCRCTLVIEPPSAVPRGGAGREYTSEHRVPDGYSDTQQWFSSKEEIDELAQQYNLVPGKFVTDHNVDYAYAQEWLEPGEQPRALRIIHALDELDEPGIEPDGVYLFPKEYAQMQFEPGQLVFRVDVHDLPLGLDPGRVASSQGEVGFVAPVDIPVERVTVEVIS